VRELDLQGVGQGRGLGVRGVRAAGEPEVEHHDAPVPDHHVLGLEVAVHDADRVGRREAASCGQEDVSELAPATRPRARPGVELRALDALGGKEDRVLMQADVVDRDHVGVAEPRQRLGLPQEARPVAGRAAPLVAQHLDRDLALELGIVGAVDDAHAASSEDAAHRVPPHDVARPEGRRSVRVARRPERRVVRPAHDW
jgi:hypothetical protein